MATDFATRKDLLYKSIRNGGGGGRWELSVSRKTLFIDVLNNLRQRDPGGDCQKSSTKVEFIGEPGMVGRRNTHMPSVMPSCC